MGDFADNLKLLREKNNFTRKEMADKLMVTTSAYTNYEAGYRQPKFDLLVKIADLLGVSTDKLLGREETTLMPWVEVKKIITDCGYQVEEISDEYGDTLVAIHLKIKLENGGHEDNHQVFDRKRLSAYVTDKRNQIMSDIHPLLVRAVKDNLREWIAEGKK